MANQDRRLVTNLHPKAAISEAYRLVRANLKFAQVDERLGSVLVTSAGPSEGKSVTVANLAVALAQDGYKTVVLDCDLRKPVQHRIFQRNSHRGVTSFLVEDLPLGDILIETEVPGLALIASGPIPPNPSELLGSAKMAELFSLLKQEFAMVVVDCPPVVAVSDAVVLAPMVDGVLFVVRANRTRIEMAQEAKELLTRGKARIIGVVLNDIKIKSKDYYYYYYYHEKHEKHAK